MVYTHEIMGIAEDGFTSAEILDGDQEVARTFELASGWYVEVDSLERLREENLVDALVVARDELRHYVNRTGAGAPVGLSVAGMSLWLLQRDDGKGFTLPEGG